MKNIIHTFFTEKNTALRRKGDIEDQTDRFGAKLRAKSIPGAAEAWKEGHDDFLASLKGKPKVEEDVSAELINQITDAPPAMERKVEAPVDPIDDLPETSIGAEGYRSPAIKKKSYFDASGKWDYRPGSKLRDTLHRAETKDFKNPWIYTNAPKIQKKDGTYVASSAFGPSQIIASTAKAAVNKYPNNKIVKDKGFQKYIEKYIKYGEDSVNLELRKKIKKNNKLENPSKLQKEKLKRGGTGLISKEDHEKYYPLLEQLVIEMKLDENKPTNIGEFLKAWAGNDFDSQYYKRGTGEPLFPIPPRKPKR